MSKAFTKEDSDQENVFEIDFEAEELDLLENESTEGPASGVKNYITQAGFERLKADLFQLAEVERPKVAAAAASHVDEGLSFDDIEMRAAQRRLREIDRELRILHRRLDAAEVVQPELQSGDRVLFGATVTVLDEDDATRVYRIVGAHEGDAKLGKISWRSPIAQALLQAKVGDAVTLHLPHGEEDLEVLKIEYKPIPNS
jgi:transcription elongation factor GreB